MKTYYINYDEWYWCDAQGVRLPAVPKLLANVVEQWELHFIHSDKTTVDLSTAAAHRCAVDNNFNHATDPMCRTLNDGIDSTDADVGMLIVTLDTTTPEYEAALSTSASIPAYFEYAGMNAGNDTLFPVLLDISCRNYIDAGGDALTSIPANYETTGGTTTPDPTADCKEYWIDIDAERWCDKNGAFNVPSPILQHGSTPQWKINFISQKTGAVVASSLAAYTSFHVAAHTTFRAATPAVRCLNDSIYSVNKDDGILLIVPDCRNATFAAAIGTTAATVKAYIEILCLDAAAQPALPIQLEIVFKNSIDPVGGNPPGVVGNWYTKAEVDALVLARLTRQESIGGHLVNVTLYCETAGDGTRIYGYQFDEVV